MLRAYACYSRALGWRLKPRLKGLLPIVGLHRQDATGLVPGRPAPCRRRSTIGFSPPGSVSTAGPPLARIGPASILTLFHTIRFNRQPTCALYEPGNTAHRSSP